jgi:hypothetical protein
MFRTEFITLLILATTVLCSGQQLLPSPEIQKEENFGTPANIVEDDTSTDCTDYSDQVFEQNYLIHSLDYWESNIYSFYLSAFVVNHFIIKIKYVGFFKKVFLLNNHFRKLKYVRRKT